MLTTIIPFAENNEPMEPASVIVASLNGKLAVHKTMNGPGFTLTHVPSGFAVRTGIVSKRKAEDLLLALENVCDWNFRNPYAKKWKNLMTGIWPLVRDVPQFPN